MRICIEELAGHLCGDDTSLTLEEILDHAYGAESELFRTQDQVENALEEMEREDLGVDLASTTDAEEAESE